MLRNISNRVMAPAARRIIRGNASLTSTTFIPGATTPQGDGWAFASKSPEVEGLDSFQTSLKSALGPPSSSTASSTTASTTTTASTASGPVARKDMDVFDQIFDNIFSTRESFDVSTPSSGVNQASVNRPQKAKLMPSIQAMFESKHRHQPADSFVSIDKLISMTRASSVGSSAQLLKSMSKSTSPVQISTSRTAKQSISIPLSVSQLGQQILSQDLTQSLHDNSTQIIQALAPTASYMASLGSDYDLSDFIRVFILDVYAMGSSVDETSIESIQKACNATPSRPPVNSLTLSFLLKEAISLLSNQYQAPLEAINVFEEAKRMGVEVFVIGCTTMVYNQVLSAKWAAYRDISMIEDLVREMQINSVYGNTETSILLKSILSGSNQGTNDLNVKNYSNVNGSSTGYLWSRLDALKQKYLEEYRQELNRYLLKSSLKRA